jgi:hypothetical protein
MPLVKLLETEEWRRGPGAELESLKRSGGRGQTEKTLRPVVPQERRSG